MTLIGPGGVGKTRLALEPARCLTLAFPDGVTFVPLAAAPAVGDLRRGGCSKSAAQAAVWQAVGRQNGCRMSVTGKRQPYVEHQ